jgi:hypothetical protein
MRNVRIDRACWDRDVGCSGCWACGSGVENSVPVKKANDQSVFPFDRERGRESRRLRLFVHGLPDTYPA